MQHPWKASSILAQAYQHQLPFSVHPGIGYDIITNHPSFMGSVVGRAASWDFDRFCEAVDGLDGGVVLSIGSAIMGPQVFEKSLSCVHNVRFQRREKSRPRASDLRRGPAGWWRLGLGPGRTPKDNAYYLRFCKSYSRMGGAMQYVCCDNVRFVHHLLHAIQSHENSSD